MSWLAHIDARSLALVRILAALLVLYNVAERGLDAYAVFSHSSFVSLPDSMVWAGPGGFSFFWVNGNGWFQYCVFAVAAAAAVLLLVGVQTALCAVCLALFQLSVRFRNPLMISSGDKLLAGILVCLALLPCASRFALGASAPQPPAHTSGKKAKAGVQGADTPVPALPACLLVCYVAAYTFTHAVYKTEQHWADGSALYFVLRSQFASPLAPHLLMFPSVLAAAARAVPLVEALCAPALLLPVVRVPAAAALACVHLVWLAFTDMHFSAAVCLAGLCLFVPSWVWDCVTGRPPAATATRGNGLCSAVRSLVALGLLGLVAHTLVYEAVPRYKAGAYEACQRAGLCEVMWQAQAAVGLDHLSCEPALYPLPTSQTRVLAVANLKGGVQADVTMCSQGGMCHPELIGTTDDPKLPINPETHDIEGVRTRFPSWRWRLLYHHLTNPLFATLRRPLLMLLCREWNGWRRHRGDAWAESMVLLTVTHRTGYHMHPVDGALDTLERVECAVGGAR